MKIFKVGAILSSISHTVDRGLRLGFMTQEVSTAEKMVITEFFQSYGWLLFRENDYQPEDIPREDVENKGKSPSRRLRAVFFVLYSSQGNKKEDFQKWYEERMEEIIDQVKRKIEETQT